MFLSCVESVWGAFWDILGKRDGCHHVEVIVLLEN